MQITRVKDSFTPHKLLTSERSIFSQTMLLFINIFENDLS